MKLDGTIISAKELDNYLKEQMKELKIPGLSIAIINNAKIAYYRTFGLANSKTGEKVYNHTIFQASSLSKPVFAYFVMKMVENGVLDLDTPLYKYLPIVEIEDDERHKKITARMVLCHNSGLPNIKTDTLELLFDPGTGFGYNSFGYNHLAKVLQKLLNKTPQEMDKFFQEVVARPLKMPHAYFVKNEYAYSNKAMPHNEDGIIKDWTPWWPESRFIASGALHTEAVSFAKFLISIMEEQGLKPSSIDEMLKEQTKSNLDWQSNITGWGLGFCQRTFKQGVIHSHVGYTQGYSSACMFDKDKKFGYVFFTNMDQAFTFHVKLEEVLFGDE